jgi:DNA uptake protein ComE-like DNA-binding protein
MKYLSGTPFRNWFGYTRRERRSSFILLLIIIALTGLKYIIPESKMKVEVIQASQWDNSGASRTVRNTVVLNSTRKVSGAAKQQKKLLDLNSCDSASLEALPGIGPVLSARIIKYRNLLGGFASISQLKEVYGLSEETFNMISGRISADSLALRKIEINSADFKQIIRFPYFNKYEVTAILKYRELKGKISTMNELIDNKLIPIEKAVKVKPYLKFGR